MIYFIIYLCGVVFEFGSIVGFPAKSHNWDMFEVFHVLLWFISIPLLILLRFGNKFARWL